MIFDWSGFFAPPTLVLLSAWFGALLVSFSMLSGYRLAVCQGWVLHSSLPRDDVALSGLCSHPAMWPSLCEVCGVRLSILSRLPLSGWLFGCRQCGSHGSSVYPLLEVLASIIAALAYIHLGVFDLIVLALGVMLWATCASCDRVSFSAPLVFLLILFWLGLLFSPLASLDARLTGSFVLFLIPCFIPLYQRFRRPSLTSHVASDASSSSDTDSESPSVAPPDPLSPDAFPPSLIFGSGDWLALSCLGAWLGLYPGVLALLIGAVFFAATQRFNRPGAFLPSLSLGFGLVVVVLFLDLLVVWDSLPTFVFS